MAENEHTASVYGKNLPISTKQTHEICSFIRGKSIAASKAYLQQVMAKQKAIPFKKFNQDTGHKRTMAAGRYPFKASKYMIKMLESLEANASNKGLDTDALYIKTIISNWASRPFHFGRKRRVKMRRTHVQIIAEERENKEKKRAPPQKKAQPAPQVQKQEHKQQEATQKEQQKK